MILFLLYFSVIQEHNEVRKSYDLRTFVVDSQLMEWADAHAQEMARKEGIFHSNRGVFENVAVGKLTVKGVMKLWMDSPSHRRNILNPKLTRIGAAVYKYKGQYYWCVMML